VAITKEPSGNCVFFVGAVRPGLDHNKCHCYTNDAYFIQTHDGSLCGNGRTRTDPQGQFALGDRIGVWVDLDAGWLRFYRNGKRCGSGFTEGVTGPLVRGKKIQEVKRFIELLDTYFNSSSSIGQKLDRMFNNKKCCYIRLITGKGTHSAQNAHTISDYIMSLVHSKPYINLFE